MLASGRISSAYRKPGTRRQQRPAFNDGVTHEPAPGTRGRSRRRGVRVAGVLVAVVAIAAALGHQSAGSSSSTTPAATDPASAAPAPRADLRRPLGEADGAVPEGTTVFDDEVPGVANLDPALLAALRRAASDAARDGVSFVVDSGWRSPAYQEHLLRQAVATYGSERAAARWAATPATSAHVSGDAVDLGPADGRDWLSRNGAAYALCRIYGNEPWHFELRPEAAAGGCPPPYRDPTFDPRLQG